MSAQPQRSFMATFARSRWAPVLFIGVGLLFAVVGFAAMFRADSPDGHITAIIFLALGGWNVVVGILGAVLGAKKRKARREDDSLE